MISILRLQFKKLIAVISLILIGVAFQNCNSQGFNSQLDLKQTDLSSSSGSSGDFNLIQGKALYDQKCAQCHGAYSSSNLSSRSPNSARYLWATTNISVMSSLSGALNEAQVDSIMALFGGGSGPINLTSTTSRFACATGEENFNPRGTIRLTGSELKNTFAVILPQAVWSSVAIYYFYLPSDGLNGQIESFQNMYSAVALEDIIKFNEKISEALVASNTTIQAFLGSCASTTSFAKTCFDSFMSSKASRILRAAVSPTDSVNYWAAISQSTAASDQIKTLVQLLFNDARFLFHIELGSEPQADSKGRLTLTSYEVANRLAYGLTDSPADDLLWADAALNRLTQFNLVQSHVDRLATTSAFKNKTVEFFKFYSGTQSVSAPSSNLDFLQGYSINNLSTSAENELKDYLQYTVFTQQGTLKDLFTSQNVFPNASSLAQVYGTGVWSSGQSPQLAPNHAGLLSRAYFNISNVENIPYITRAKKLRGHFLCSPVAPPTIDTISQRPQMTESDIINLTRRDFLNKSTLSAPLCITCHAQMNDLAFLTGNYDTLGRYVSTEKVFHMNQVVAQNQVLVAGIPHITSADERTLTDLNQLQSELAASDALQRCMSRKALQFFEKRTDDLILDSCTLNKLDTKLKTQGSLKDFLLEKMRTPAMMYKKIN